MSHSLNEIESLAKQAARGTGLSWGMAQEAAKATRWLVSHDLPGVTLLADVLTQNDHVSHTRIAPTSLDGKWSARSRTLCPLASGVALNDCADRLASGQSLEMGQVSHPLLVVPFAAWASLHIEKPVVVTWMSIRVETDGFKIWYADPMGEIDVPIAESLTCAPANRLDDCAIAPNHRGTPCRTAWALLGVFAGRTHAPATAESRRLGAGAGVSDND